MSRRAIIFGGAGFIGTHLARALLERDYSSVVVADYDLSRERVPSVRYVHCDVRHSISDDIAEPPDEAYNLAAIHRTPGHPDREYFETNVSGAQNVTEYCQRLGVPDLIFTSSIAVYGPSEEPVEEATPVAPVSAYGKSKLEAEEIHRRWLGGSKTRRLVIARPGTVFGPGEAGNYTRLARVLRRRAFFYAGRHNTIKAGGGIDDLIRSMEFALNHAKPLFLYNYCYPHPYNIQEICEAFHDVGGLPRPLGAVPLGLLLFAARLFEFAHMAGIRTSINRERVLKIVRSNYIRPTTLVDAGFTFETDLHEGLRRWLTAPPSDRFV